MGALQDKIKAYLMEHPQATSAQMVALTGLSRQRVAVHLARLIEAGDVVRSGSTRNATYRLRAQGDPLPVRHVELVKKLSGLEEDRVFDEIDLRLRLKSSLTENVYRIAYYAFTEMLNNAIDHSGAARVFVRFELTNNMMRFRIRDHGRGAFANIRGRFRLESEFAALEHLLKGKQTTFPEQHSGQGIFFTSRIADVFTLRSHKLELLVENIKDDIFAGDCAFTKGTEVTFELRRHSRKQLKSLFDKYSNDEFVFDRTNLRMKLTAGREYLSRSQAKRMVLGLEQFDRLVLDFAGVRMIGQAFADEVFRVFQNRHPQMEITFCNANEAVTGMILRVVRGVQ